MALLQRDPLPGPAETASQLQSFDAGYFGQVLRGLRVSAQRLIDADGIVGVTGGEGEDEQRQRKKRAREGGVSPIGVITASDEVQYSVESLARKLDVF